MTLLGASLGLTLSGVRRDFTPKLIQPMSAVCLGGNRGSSQHLFTDRAISGSHLSTVTRVCQMLCSLHHLILEKSYFSISQVKKPKLRVGPLPKVTGLMSSSVPWETQVSSVTEQHSFHQPQKLRATSQVLTVLLPVDPKSWSPRGISAPVLADDAEQKTNVMGPQAQGTLSQAQAGPGQSSDSFRSRSKPTKSHRDRPDLVASWTRTRT